MSKDALLKRLDESFENLLREFKSGDPILDNAIIAATSGAPDAMREAKSLLGRWIRSTLGDATESLSETQIEAMEDELATKFREIVSKYKVGGGEAFEGLSSTMADYLGDMLKKVGAPA